MPDKTSTRVAQIKSIYVKTSYAYLTDSEQIKITHKNNLYAVRTTSG